MQVFALAIPKPIRTVQVFALVIPASGCSVQILSTGKLPSICPVQLSSMANPVSGGLVQVFAVAETPVFRRFFGRADDPRAPEPEARVLVADNFSCISRQDVDFRRKGWLESLNQVISHSSRESSDAQDQSLF
ncbi:MAG: hypothetical protein KDA59_05535 [Planctomycetales bacterium]|nr:hypothetical protein [Planctomycetales bacterium]